ncbi:MAG TPA: cobalamin B12-binding domain-containing protein [Candidatus Udaeobacter sp.]|jgi:methylmalonyl-CoA mutase C-terminal domain/subunit|nr:cobalamin B12-binding domain-containing protein [Candidatus Udaeobacter sp.]
MTPRKIRVLVGKPGLDGHDRGAKVVAAALRDAGMEVIYTGLHQTPEQVVEAAVQEDVDVVALSILSGAHMTLFPDVLELMKQRGASDRLLTGGGIIPAEDMETLKQMGVGRLFGPGSSTQEIVHYIRDWFGATHGQESLAPLPPARMAEPMTFEPEVTPRRVESRSPRRSAVKVASRRARPARPRRKPARPRRKPAAARSSRPGARTASRRPKKARTVARRVKARKTARRAKRAR